MYKAAIQRLCFFIVLLLDDHSLPILAQKSSRICDWGGSDVDGNPPDKPKAPEVEFSTKEFLYEEVKIYRQPELLWSQSFATLHA